MTDAFDKRLRELLVDNIRGSRVIAADVSVLFGDLLNNPAVSDTALQELIREACTLLQKAHPSLSVVRKLCDSMKSTLALEDDTFRKRLAAALGQWRSDRFETTIVAMAEFLLPLFKSESRILCHSHSSTVLGVLKHVSRMVKKLSIVQTVSYPMKEGIRMAKELAEVGIDVRLIADAGIAASMGKCDLVLLGADSVHSSGVVNKLGSLGIALVAKHFNIPVYAVADSMKFVAGDSAPVIKENDSAELAELSDPRIAVDNVYFDITPLELFEGIVTEEGFFHRQLQ